LISDKYTKRYKTVFFSDREGYGVMEEASETIVSPGPFTYLEAQDNADLRNQELALERMKS
jgi:hypothetical protein